MEILFCTDGSAISYAAIKNFSKWVTNCFVDILCVADWSYLSDNITFEDNYFFEVCSESTVTTLDSAEKFVKKLGLKVREKIKLCGEAVESIIEVCNKKEYDIIILGSHGKKGLQKWLGSVSQEIAGNINLSTYISKTANNRKKILFAVDNREGLNKTINTAIKYLDFSNKEIYLTTVYEIPDYLFLEGNINSEWMLEIQKKLETQSKLLLNKFEDIFSKNDLNIAKKEVLNGIPATELLKYTKKENIDLIVCGTRLRKNFAKIILNSVSQRLLENVECDVLIIK